MSGKAALLYPRCMVKAKLANFIRFFFSEIYVAVPSEAEVQKIKAHSTNSLLKINPFVPAPMGDEGQQFENSLQSMMYWGQQMGLGESVNFETFYSMLSTSPDEEVHQVLKAMKGKNKEDLLMAARIFLALSVEVDMREDELEQEMARVEEQAQKLSSLVEEDLSQGEGADKVNFIEPLNKARERLRAWYRLISATFELPEALPLGESIAIKDMMDAAYEGISQGRTAVDLFKLTLPTKKELLADQSLAERVRKLFSNLIDVLGDTCASVTQLYENKRLFEIVQEIDATFNELDITEPCPQLVLTIYPGYSWVEVMREAVKIREEGQEKPSAPAGNMCGSFFIV